MGRLINTTTLTVDGVTDVGEWFAAAPPPQKARTMSDDRRSIELEVEVHGSPEEVWRAIATGPGISSWYVPHTVDEREGGAATASFGPAPEA